MNRKPLTEREAWLVVTPLFPCPGIYLKLYVRPAVNWKVFFL
jgi:hypothetical protein